MKKNLSFALLFMGVSFYTVAQTTFQNATGPAINLSKNGGSALELEPKPPTTEGTIYYADQEQLGTVFLKDGRKFENQKIKYDLSKNWLEIYINNEVKVASDEIVQKFELANPTSNTKQIFINASELMLKDLKMQGFLEVLEDGNMKLLAGKKLEFKPTNYNALMDVGDKNNKLIKKDVLYLAKGNQLIEVSNKNKAILDFFGSKSENVASFADKNDLKLRKTEDLKRAVEYFNTL